MNSKIYGNKNIKIALIGGKKEQSWNNDTTCFQDLL